MVMIAAVENFSEICPLNKKNVHMRKQLFRESARDNPRRHCGLSSLFF